MVKPEPKLTHMPKQIKEKITDSVKNVGTILAISQMSKEFLSLARDSPCTLKEVTVKIFFYKLTVTLKSRFFKPVPDCFKCSCYENSKRKKLVMEFTAHEDGVLMRNKTNNWQKVLPEKDYRKAAVQYLLETIGSKTTIKEFVLKVDGDLFKDDLPRDPESRHFSALYPKKKFEEDRKMILDEVESFLRKCKHQLLVEEIILRIEMTEPQMLQLIPYLEPGTLEDINLFYFCPRTFAFNRPMINLEQLSETEQWKKATKVRMSRFNCDVPFDAFTHLEQFEFVWTRPHLTMKAVLEIFLSQSTFKSWGIGSEEHFDQSGVKEYLRELEPTKFECRGDGEMRVEMALPNEPNTRISMSLSSTNILLHRF